MKSPEMEACWPAGGAMRKQFGWEKGRRGRIVGNEDRKVKGPELTGLADLVLRVE